MCALPACAGFGGNRQDTEECTMIQFGTGGWRAIIGDGFTKANIQRVGAALGRRILREPESEKEIVIGYDRRFLSREAAIWFSEAIAAEGVKVNFVNLSAPTPQMTPVSRSTGAAMPPQSTLSITLPLPMRI